MTEQAKGERCGRRAGDSGCTAGPFTHVSHSERPHYNQLAGDYCETMYCHAPTPPTAPEPAICPSCQEIRCDPDCDNPRAARRPAPGPAKGGEARVEYAEGMMYPWRVIQGLEEDGETPNCVASLREKSVAEFVTGLINERAQLRAANEALREGMRDLANGVLRIGWDRTADHVHEQAVQVIAQLDSDAERGD
jgi:hypothetical protein